MAMSWDEWQAANPAPYDLQKFVNDANAKYAGIQYDQRPQEFFDEYNKQRDANMQWQAQYQNQLGGASNEAMITNPYVQQSGRAIYDQAPGGVTTPRYIGESKPATLTPEEIASGIGGIQNFPVASTGAVAPGAQSPQVMPGVNQNAGPGGAGAAPFGSGSAPAFQDYYDPADPFGAFRVEQMDPRYSQTTAAQVTPGGIAEMMNPYLQSVRDQTLTDIERQRQLAQMTTDDQANAARAFGGNRHGVANALTNDAFARQSAQAYANLNAQGFNAAAGLAGQNAGLAQQAGLSNAANYMAGRGQDISQNQAFMGNALAQRGQDIGWNLGQMGQQLNAYNVAGNLLNSSANMDWNSLNQANNATSQPGQSSTTTPGADPWNTLIGGLITGWGLTRG